MTRRGPKAIEIARLKEYAELWSVVLLTVREGRPGKLCMVRPGETSPSVIAKVVPAEGSEDGEGLRILRGMRGRRGLLWVESPILPDPALWETLKCARSTGSIRNAFIALGEYLQAFWQPPDDFFNPTLPVWGNSVLGILVKLAKEHADELRKAKHLRDYPSARRPTSDNKRVEFFAKVLSGLALGRKPTYALKILAGWTPPSIQGTIEGVSQKKKNFTHS